MPLSCAARLPSWSKDQAVKSYTLPSSACTCRQHESPMFTVTPAAALHLPHVMMSNIRSLPRNPGGNTNAPQHPIVDSNASAMRPRDCSSTVSVHDAVSLLTYCQRDIPSQGEGASLSRRSP